ncbi:hypothetical protein Ocin01_12460 [Orchesella cincta]|uniref:Uncharacterized protein n=1 Tax=Orchesella cincta TaxID=48709 RepID=A0A1D2MMD9_ORCCI|nr:hypothetical protein Ocin01_12460 [Orchesella cincta]
MSCPHCDNNFSLSESNNQELLVSEESEYAIGAVLISSDFYPLCLQMEVRVVTVAVMAIVTMTTFLALVQEAEARPSRSTVAEGWPEYMSLFHRGGDPHRRAVNECDNSSAVREICQRCAKATKSKWAYPLCCEAEEDTRRFCVNFLNFGISPNDVINQS